MTTDRIPVWDPLVRVFHWSVVACVATAWFSADDFRALHLWAGYSVVAFVALRLVWGFAGSRYARFAQFVRGGPSVWAYGRGMLAREAPRYIGHNPLGGWMVLALLLTLAALGATGWMMSLDAFFGEEGIEAFHQGLANGLLVLVAVHVSGALLTGWKHGENLVRAMVTGTKRGPGPGDID